VTSRRVPWWGWLLVAASWAAGLGWAVVVVIIGQADREVVVRGQATVAAIVAGSVLTAVAAALVVTFRQLARGPITWVGRRSRTRRRGPCTDPRRC